MNNDERVGKTVGNSRFLILDVISAGGMGIVYKAQDNVLKKIVVLKCIKPELAADKMWRSKFVDEAVLTAQFEHNNIVRVEDLIEDQGVLFIRMEYVDGKDLAAIIQSQGPLPWQSALPIFKKVLTAMQHAHTLGVIHRDIKPRNIMLTTATQEVKVLDFGIAKFLRSASQSTSATLLGIGTLFYMSPEQVKGAVLDQRSDIYSLGVTFYEILTGRLPFDEKKTDFEIIESKIKGKYKPLRSFRPEIPIRLAEIIERSFRADSARRYASIDEILQDLQRMENSETGRKLPDDKGMKIKYMITILALTLFCICGYLFLRPHDKPGSEPGVVPQVDTTAVSQKSAVKYVEFHIESTPAADLYLNGSFVGRTPYDNPQLQSGTYTIEIKEKKFQTWKEQVDLAAGTSYFRPVTLAPYVDSGEIAKQNETRKSTTVQPSRQPGKSFIDLHVMPGGSRIELFVDNDKIIRQIPGTDRIPVPEGKHVLRITCNQISSKDTVIFVDGDRPLPISCYCEGMVSVKSFQAGTDQIQRASVRLNNQVTDYETWEEIRLPAGRYQISVRASGFAGEPNEQTLLIKPEFYLKNHSVVFNLRKN